MFVSKRARADLWLVSLVGIVALLPVRSQANIISWNAGSGSWSVNTNWSPQFVPGDGDFVNFFSTAPNGTIITYDFVHSIFQTQPTLASLNIGLSGGNPGAANTLMLNTGSTLVAVTENIGTSGVGAINHSIGTHAVTGNLFLGTGAGDQGIYTLSGGSLSAASQYVGYLGAGTFNQSAGTNTVSSFLEIGFGSSANGAYTLSGTGSLTVSGIEEVGNSGIGTFSQTDGTHIANGGITLATNAGSSGAYTLSNGSLVINSSGLIVGNSGAATFTQSGGTNSSSSLQIGFGASANGAYTLSGGFLIVGGSEAVGLNGTGNFNQTGGIHRVAGGIAVGTNPGSSGTYNFSNGNLAIQTFGLVVGGSGAGIFNQSNGTVDLGQLPLGTLILGRNAGSTGTYTLSGNGSIVTGSAGETIGAGGVGTFNHSSGTHTVAGDLTIGDQAGATGAYNLSLGSLSVSGQENIGNSGIGTFTQSGGTHVAGTLNLGFNAGSTGTYNLSSGLLTSGREQIGFSGTGVFNQTGGLHDLSEPLPQGQLILGVQAGASGTYNLSGGTLLATQELVGASGFGSIVQTGGTNTIDHGGLLLGTSPGSTGEYTLSGNATVSAFGELIGSGGSGMFVQTGGTNTVQTNLNLGASGGSSGTYLLSGGSLSVGGEFVVGGFGAGGNVPQPGGTGVLTVSGTGVLTASAVINVMNTPGTSLNLEGGTISAPAIVTGGNPPLFNWTSGTLNITTSLSLDAVDTNTWTGGAFGPSLTLGSGQTLQVNGDEVIGTVGGFALTLNDGSAHNVTGNITVNGRSSLSVSDNAALTYSTLTLAGGTINGTIQNTTAFVYQSGQFNGRLINLGTATLGSNFTAGNGIENDTSLSLATGQTLTVNGAGLDNFGTLTMTGGRINGNGGVVNDVGGLMQISGAAAINTAFTNLGELHVNGSLTLASGGINSGITTIAAGGGIRGGAFTNEGTLTLSGGGISSVSTTNAAGGVLSGTGGISGTFANSAGGIVQVASGNTLTITHAWSNAGLVTMQGGRLGPSAITNSGVIQGLGIVGGAVTNTGTLRASGGELDIAGAGSTNSAGGQIQVSAGSTMLFVQGLASNAGTIALSGGTFDNGNAAMTNTGSILGAGTVRTGGLLNQGSISFADASTSVFGSLTTDASGGGGNVQLSDNTTTFFGAVTVGAGTTFQVNHGTARFLSSFTNNGTYITDPSTSSFTDLTIGATGAQVGGSGDVYLISGNLVNHSTQNNTFDLSQTDVEFTGTGSHNLGWSGADFGSQYIGYIDNFALGTLELAAGSSLMLFDASGLTRNSAGLYVGTLRLDGGLGDTSAELQAFIRANLTNINSGDVLNIYYDPLQAGNSYLGGMTFALGGGGFLEPVSAQTQVPEPSTAGMLLLAAACGWLVRRRRRA